MVGDRLKGTVKWFNATKRFGFITPADGGEELFVHQSSIKPVGFQTLAEGQAVEFAVAEGEDGRAKAVDVTVAGGSAAAGGGGGGRRVAYGGGRYGGGGGYGFSGSGGAGRGGGWRGGGGSCYSCGEQGHIARDCYNSAGGGGGGRYGGGGGRGGGGGGGGGGGCYNCGETGHFARECPSGPK